MERAACRGSAFSQEKTMSKLKTLTAAALLVGGASMGAIAQEASYAPADTNKDGYTSRSEWREQHAPAPGTATRIGTPAGTAADSSTAPELSYRSADTDADGYVSSSEWDRYHAEVLRSLRERGVSRPEGEFSYREADLNKDGMVSNDEWDRYQRQHMTR
jgi:hypothetical protein